MPRLEEGQQPQGGGRELGGVRKGLKARDEAVPTEHGHEPGQARRRQRTRADRGAKAQGREIDQAALVGQLERPPGRDQLGRRCDPVLHARAELRAPLAAFVRRLRGGFATHAGPEMGGHLHPGGPVGLWLEVYSEHEAIFPELGRLVRGDHGLPFEVLAAVPEDELVIRHLAVQLALLLQLVLHLEEVGEVGARLEADLELHRLPGVVGEREVLGEALAHRPPSQHGEVRIDVDGARGDRGEELDLEVGHVVDRERLRPQAVHGEDPA